MRDLIKTTSYIVISLLLASCNKDFLERVPLDQPSAETFWKSADQAEMWVNNLYITKANSTQSLMGVDITTQEAYSDNAYGRTNRAKNNIANGILQTNDSHIADVWNSAYRNIRLCYQYFDNVTNVPSISKSRRDELDGQVRFFIAFEYYKLISRFRDVPLIKKTVAIEESDVEKSPKEEVLQYIIEQLDLAIDLLPLVWPESESGRITKGAALFLKTRVLLYNNRWNEAANTAKLLMDLNLYRLDENFDDLFRVTFNNKKAGAILEVQYAENLFTHDLSLRFSPVMYNAHALIQPTPQLVNSFEMKDGLSIDESPLYDPTHPFNNRDPRFYYTFLWHGQILNDTYVPLDLSGTELNFSFTYVYFRKGIEDFRNRFRPMFLNWNLFRYADLLLMYAEAKNEASGPDFSVYDALNLIRKRAGMPNVDQNRYKDQVSLRKFIRNERRVELAGEGIRYDDIMRWEIADSVLNINIVSLDLQEWVDGPVNKNGERILKVRPVEARQFNPTKNYVWPIPQTAIDQADNLEQHAEWK